MTWKSLTLILRGKMGMQKGGVKGSPGRLLFLHAINGTKLTTELFQWF